jgi:hypothetical protein
MRLLSVMAVLAAFGSARAQATLIGTVLTDPDERPIAGAEIVFSNVQRVARADSLGRFRITGIPIGAQSLIVRITGYQPWMGTITFEDKQTVEADFLLKPVPTSLPAVEVKAPENRFAGRLLEFEERRKSGQGRFITQAEIEKESSRRLSEIIVGHVPGVHLVGTGDGDERAVSTTHNGRPQCLVQVVLNGSVVYNGGTGQLPFKINSINAEDIIGLEFYTTASTPARYSGTGGGTDKRTREATYAGPACGTLILWTKY